MNRLTQNIMFPYDWKRCNDQGHTLWTETYRKGLIFTIRRSSSEQLLAMLDTGQSEELRNYLVEAFPLATPKPEVLVKERRARGLRGSSR